VLTMTEKKKKTTRKKTTSKNRGLTDIELAKFQQLLLSKRREIIGDVSNMEGEALRKSRMDAAGDLSSMPIHMADIGSDNYSQEFALGLMDSERKIVKEIDKALSRMEKGSYGICIATGNPIPKARLKAKPWAKYSIEYAEKLEKGLAEEINEDS